MTKLNTSLKTLVARNELVLIVSLEAEIRSSPLKQEQVTKIRMTLSAAVTWFARLKAFETNTDVDCFCRVYCKCQPKAVMPVTWTVS